MFTALLTICFALSKECVTLRDDRGPYDTLRQCHRRLDEMVLFLQKAENLPKFTVDYKHCDRSKGVKT